MHEIVHGYKRAVAVNVSAADQALYIDSGFPQARGFIIATAGNLVIDTPGGDMAVVIAVPAGEIHVGATKVYHAGTTAAGITALY